MADIDEKKLSQEHLEGLPKGEVEDQLAVHLPESLRGLSEEEMAVMNKSVTKKLDTLLMPTLVVLYILNYLDRQNISSAKLSNIMTELNLSTTDYATAVAVLFAGYVSLQVPSNMIAAKISHPGIYICIWCCIWGLISACTGAVHNYAALAVCRTFLGFAEAAFFPGAIFLLSTFYEKKQMALRSAVLYSGSQIGNAFGGLFAIAILTLDGRFGLSGWRWLFIVEGALTVGLGIIFATFIPNKPKSMRWLNAQERDLLQYRLEVDRGTQDATDLVSVGSAFMMAIKDPKTWLLCGCLQMNYIAASVTNFFPVVVAGLGFDRTTTLAITAPPYLICTIVIIINGYYSDKYQRRTAHIIGPFLITIVANVIAIATTATAARYVAMCLLPGSFYSASIVILSWISSTATGPAVKRAIVYAIINALCNTPNIWTSYLYYDSPRYIVAFVVDLAAAVGLICFASATYLYLRRQNRKLDRGEPMGASGPSATQIAAGFRYQL